MFMKNLHEIWKIVRQFLQICLIHKKDHNNSKKTLILEDVHGSANFFFQEHAGVMHVFSIKRGGNGMKLHHGYTAVPAT